MYPGLYKLIVGQKPVNRNFGKQWRSRRMWHFVKVFTVGYDKTILKGRNAVLNGAYA